MSFFGAVLSLFLLRKDSHIVSITLVRLGLFFVLYYAVEDWKQSRCLFLVLVIYLQCSDVYEVHVCISGPVELIR